MEYKPKSWSSRDINHRICTVVRKNSFALHTSKEVCSPVEVDAYKRLKVLYNTANSNNQQQNVSCNPIHTVVGFQLPKT